MTKQEIVLDCLSYIGITGFSPGDSDTESLDTSDVNKAIVACNAALQEMSKRGPKSISNDERGSFFNEPTALAVNTDVTHAASIDTVLTPPDWIRECSILVPGDGDLNRIVDVTGNSLSLLRGYRGPTQNGVAATIYHDATQLQDSIKRVTAPLVATPNTPITLCDTRSQFERLPGPIMAHPTGVVAQVTQKQVGQPMLALVERRPSGLYLYLNPMPNMAMNVTYPVQLRPERFSVDDLDQDGGDDPGSEITSLDPDDIETVFLPIARHHFFTHPALLNNEARPEIEKDYQAAVMLLANGSSMEPKVSRVPVRYKGGMPRH